MKTDLCLPSGLPEGMEDQIFDFGMQITEFVAWSMHNFLVSGAMKDEFRLHTDVRMK